MLLPTSQSQPKTRIRNPMPGGEYTQECELQSRRPAALQSVMNGEHRSRCAAHSTIAKAYWTGVRLRMMLMNSQTRSRTSPERWSAYAPPFVTERT